MRPTVKLGQKADFGSRRRSSPVPWQPFVQNRFQTRQRRIDAGLSLREFGDRGAVLPDLLPEGIDVAAELLTDGPDLAPDEADGCDPQRGQAANHPHDRGSVEEPRKTAKCLSSHATCCGAKP